MRPFQGVICGRERGHGAERARVDLPLPRPRPGDVAGGEEAVREAGDEVGGAVCRGVVAVARALEGGLGFWVGGGRGERGGRREGEVDVVDLKKERKKNIVCRN